MDQKTPIRENAAPMEVLVLGLCRTGTMSMKIALEELGYKNVYHFSTVDENQPHPDLWIAALKHKYEQPAATPHKCPETDWDQILGEYNAVTDIPAACFAPELIAAYPNAKIILTTRTTTSWHKSMLRTIHALQSSYMNRFLLLFADERTKTLSHLVDLVIKYYFRGSIPLCGMEVFEEHNEMVKDIASRENREFLEFNLGDGWVPLCTFLGKEMPSHEFPRVNDSSSWRKAFRLDWDSRALILLGLFMATAIVALFMAREREAASSNSIRDTEGKKGLFF